MGKGKQSFYERVIKRPLDLGLSCLILFLLAPIFMMIAILVRWKLGTPILFRQVRPGHLEKLFTLYKFRSMKEEQDEKGDQKSDQERLTGFGRWLRETSLDELPELLNIIKGDMSFIGPRPLLIKYLPLYSKEQRRRHEVRPGLTGLAQVTGRNAIGWEDKFRLDLQYVNHITFLTDIRILTLTLGKVLRREGIHSETSVTMEEFQGNMVEETVEPEADTDGKGKEQKAGTEEARGIEVGVGEVIREERTKEERTKEEAGSENMKDIETRRGLIIIGAGGHGRSVADVAFAMKRWDTIAFLDDGYEGGLCMGFPVLGKVSDFTHYLEQSDFIIAIGNNRIRQKLQLLLMEAGARIPILVHPEAVIGNQVTLGEGTVVMAGAVINCCTQIGAGCIINTGATVDHENCLGNYVHLSPGVHLAGRVRIGERTWIGIGSSVSNDVTINRDNVIGAGAVVLKDITVTGTYVGIPARRLK